MKLVLIIKIILRDIDISLFKKYKMMTDSNNLELTFNDIKKISLDIMINKNKYGNYHDNLL